MVRTALAGVTVDAHLEGIAPLEEWIEGMRGAALPVAAGHRRSGRAAAVATDPVEVVRQIAPAGAAHPTGPAAVARQGVATGRERSVSPNRRVDRGDCRSHVQR